MTNPFPKISVVTISYNQGDFLERTICSVLDQNYPNLEYIIIDGGSTDGSVDIIKKYQDKLAYWISEKDKGMYDAIQKGMQKTTGEIMCWINSDDMFHKGSLTSVARIFSELKEVEWIQGMPTVFDESDVIIKVTDIKCWSKFNYFETDSDFIQQESTFWRRSLWERSGGYISQEYKIAGDYELWARFFRFAKLYSVQTILGGFRYRGVNQQSVDKLDEYKAEMKIIKEKSIAHFTPEEKEIFQSFINPSKSIFNRKKNENVFDQVYNGQIITYRAKLKTYALVNYKKTNKNI